MQDLKKPLFLCNVWLMITDLNFDENNGFSFQYNFYRECFIVSIIDYKIQVLE